MYAIDSKTEVSVKIPGKDEKFFYGRRKVYSGLMPDEKIVIINQSRIKMDEDRYFSSVLRKKWDDVLIICRHDEVCSFALLTRERVKHQQPLLNQICWLIFIQECFKKVGSHTLNHLSLV